jgi:hypothetical protein
MALVHTLLARVHDYNLAHPPQIQPQNLYDVLNALAVTTATVIGGGRPDNAAIIMFYLEALSLQIAAIEHDAEEATLQ